MEDNTAGPSQDTQAPNAQETAQELFGVILGENFQD